MKNKLKDSLSKFNPVSIYKKLDKKLAKIESTGYSGAIELFSDLENEHNKLHCKKCGAIMPIFRILVIAKGYKNGEIYKVKCRKCGYINNIIKGEW